MLANTRAFLRFFAFLALTFVLVPLHLGVALFSGTMLVARLWHKGVCRIFGVRGRLYGVPVSPAAHVLFVANHISYLDIIVLGALLNCRFVAKKEVAGWPLFGFLAKLQRTVFIDRNPRQAATARQALQTALNDGGHIMLFPEGTSTNGKQVLPFKPSLFDLFLNDAAKANMVIQPVALVPTLVNDEPVATSDERRDVYAWYAEMELVPHLWALAKEKSVDVAVYILPTIDPTPFKDRKILAAAAHEIVAECLNAAQVTV